MNLSIISDIHDNLVNLNKCLSWCNKNKIEKIICCGDVTNFETLQFLSSHFTEEIFLVRGNCEIYDDHDIKNLSNINYHGRIGFTQISDKNIGFCHEPFLIENVLKKGNCDIVFYGHTHKPWLDERANIKIINPGTLGGVFQRACFAVWDTEKEEPELKILDLL